MAGRQAIYNGTSEYINRCEAYVRCRYGSEERALTVQGAGVVGSRPFHDSVMSVMKSVAGVRQAGATIIPTAHGNPVSLILNDDTAAASELVVEGNSDNSAVDPTAESKTLGAYKFDPKWMKIAFELAQDGDFDVMGWLAKVAGERNARGSNPYFTTGSGVGQPLGFLTGAGVGKTSEDVDAFTYFDVLDLLHSLDPAYRDTGRCVWQAHDDTFLYMRKMEDANGNLYFPPAVWDSGRILGHRYVTNNDMPSLGDGAGSAVLAIGDLSAYVIRDAAPIIVIATELFSAAGAIGYRMFGRMDGKLIDADACKKLVTAAS